MSLKLKPIEIFVYSSIFLGVLATLAATVVTGWAVYANFYGSGDAHDVRWQGERVANIGYFAGCHYRTQLIEADDTFFSSEWQSLSKQYELTVEDIDKEIPECMNTWRKDGVQPGMNVDVSKLEKYQKRFLNREFSVLNPNWKPNKEKAVVDTTNWKTYRSAKYGFELDYPGDWSVNEYYSPGLWLSLMSPYDVCSETPESCTNFSVRFTPPNQEDGLVQINLETVVITPGVEERNNVYIPIHASCMTSVPFPDFTLRDRRREIIMFVIQDGFPENIDMDEATKVCETGQLENSLFEKILTTLRSV